MEILSNLSCLKKLLQRTKHIKLYGAGLRLSSFLECVTEMRIPFHAECILVSSAKGNPNIISDIPVVEVSKASFCKEDRILLTLSERFVEEALKTLEKYGVKDNIYGIDYEIIDSIPYERVYEAIKPFSETYPKKLSGLNHPEGTTKRHVWSCWWQGEEKAPELVKKCWESQRKNLPENVEHTIITWENYQNYIEFPEFIIEKTESGKILSAHLADIARCCLLYKYGGIWLDATIYMTGQMPEEYFNYEILTRSTGERIYRTDVSWVTWFLGGKKGEKLYQFLMEAFFDYLKYHDKVLHYYMIDFLMAVAYKEISGIAEKMKKIPINNVNADRLQKYLGETYDWKLYCTCTEGGCLQKLTYKGSGYDKTSFYQYLVNREIHN